MMWHAGLRGGIALVLCFGLGDWVDVLDGEGTRAALTEATFALICVFLLVFGGSTQLCLKLLKIPMGGTSDPSELVHEDNIHHHGCFWQALHLVQERLLYHILMGKEAEETLHMPGGVVAAVLKEACQMEGASPRELPAACPSRVSANGEARRDMIDLFGTTDPVHNEDYDEFEHIIRMAHQASTNSVQRSDVPKERSGVLQESTDVLQEATEDGADKNGDTLQTGVTTWTGVSDYDPEATVAATAAEEAEGREETGSEQTISH